jgi:hypothetical protein
MINYKQTIKNFSKILPTADLDMLFKLMDAIVEEKLLNFPTTTSTPYTPVSPYYSTHNTNKTNAEI